MDLLRPQGTEVPFCDWKVSYYKYTRYDDNVHPTLIKSREIDDSAINAMNIEFVFDTEPVSVEYANLLAENQNEHIPAKMGVTLC